MNIFVEGGGDYDALHRACRRGFSMFFEKAGLKGRLPRVYPCGSRNSAYEAFCEARRQGKKAILLVDSEDLITNPDPATGLTLDPWQHFINRGDPWTRPPGATNDHAQVMTVCMETWFLVDWKTTEEFYGRHFDASALPARSQKEAVPKPEVFRALKKATAATSKRGYSKGGHSFDLLAELNPAVVEAGAPHAHRLLVYLRANC